MHIRFLPKKKENTAFVRNEDRKIEFLRHFLEKTSEENGLSRPYLEIKKSDYAFAYVKKRPLKYTITFTTSLIQKLDAEEIKAIAAHEICHRKKHSASIFDLAIAPVMIINQFAMFHLLFLGLSFQDIKEAAAIFGVSSAILYLNRYRLHKKEHEADAFAASIVAKDSTINALYKTYNINMHKRAERILVLHRLSTRLFEFVSEFAKRAVQNMPGCSILGLLQNAAESCSKTLRKVYEIEMKAVKWLLDVYAKLYSLSPYSTHPTIKKRVKEISKIGES
ncbi:MAG: M48 family metalloprotease [Candidatus Anstonellaceae archaeon]